MKIKVMSLLFLFLGLTSCLKNHTDGIQVLDVAKYEKKITERNIQLIDVRTPEEFAAGHVPGAVNIDVKNPNFEEEIQKLDTKKNYFIYCKSGVRAKLATEKMQEKGLKNAKNFKDGMSTYKGTVAK